MTPTVRPNTAAGDDQHEKHKRVMFCIGTIKWDEIERSTRQSTWLRIAHTHTHTKPNKFIAPQPNT